MARQKKLTTPGASKKGEVVKPRSVKRAAPPVVKVKGLRAPRQKKGVRQFPTDMEY
jgi:hypothetical protein